MIFLKIFKIVVEFIWIILKLKIEKKKSKIVNFKINKENANKT